MSYFTPNESQPSEYTLQMIRIIARSFPGKNIPENMRALRFS